MDVFVTYNTHEREAVPANIYNQDNMMYKVTMRPTTNIDRLNDIH
jgi:hypothetical protein